MSDLIDRQSALGVCKEYCWYDDEDDFIDGYNTAVKDISEAIKELPTIEAEPVRHGRWIEGTSRGSFSIYCSYCGSQKETICPTDYCPACGALMDGG